MMKSQQKYFYIFLVSLLAISLTWVLINLFGLRSYFGLSNSSICIFKNVTGYPCPSCGTTRSVLAILHGKFAEAFYWNILGFFALISLMSLLVWLMYDLIKQKVTFFDFYKMVEVKFKNNSFLLILILLLLCNWAWIIHKGI